MTATTKPIPHYQRAHREHSHLPAMSNAEYVNRLRAQQRAIVDCIDRGRWAESSSCETFTELLLQRLVDCRLFVDVGAEAGFYTYLATRHMPPGGQIVTIEPDPIRCRLLRELFGPSPHVEVLELAIGTEPGTTTLVKPRGCSATSADVEGEHFSVRTDTLDNLLCDADVDIIKMDIEGAEAEAFAGMWQLLTKQHTEIFLEYHPWIDNITPGGVESMHRLLREADYRIYRTDSGRPQRVDRLGGRAYLVPARRDPIQP